MVLTDVCLCLNPEGTVMPYFHLYVLDRESRAIQSFDLIALDRAVAARRARQEMLANGGVACEIWQALPSTQAGGGRRKWSLAYQHRQDEAADSQRAGARLPVAREL
jgi:hypothetical protein